MKTTPPRAQAPGLPGSFKPKWHFLFATWTLLALAFTTQYYLSNKGAQIPRTLLTSARLAFTEWYLLGLLFYPTLWMCRRFPIDSLQWRNLAAHVLAGLAFAVVHVVAYVAMDHWISHYTASLFESVQFWLIRRFLSDFLYYWTFVLALAACGLYFSFKDRAYRAMELEARLSQSQLQALKMQLHPHFLFNTLNTIAELVHVDPDAADRMITQLSALLRTALEAPNVQETPLSRELEFAQGYLEIERVRVGDRLTVRFEIDPETLSAQVPNLILQPLIENALRHGIAPCERGGAISIRAQRANGSLTMEVLDDGAGLPAKPRDGVGLSNCRARLAQLYGEDHRFEIGPNQPRGAAVRISIPFKT